jgi:hypothetical protein
MDGLVVVVVIFYMLVFNGSRVESEGKVFLLPGIVDYWRIILSMRFFVNRCVNGVRFEEAIRVIVRHIIWCIRL